MPREVVIDENSGFCFGVINAIRTAEEHLRKHPFLYCLGDIVHNSEEVRRLTSMGLRIITNEQLHDLRDTTVLIRAHGEPPETYLPRKTSSVLISPVRQSFIRKPPKVWNDTTSSSG